MLSANGFESRLSFAYFIQHLFERFGEDIENQRNFREIIDAFFSKYYIWLQFEFYLTAFGYQVPLYLQMFLEDRTTQMLCLQVCMISQIILFAKELNAAVSEGISKYFA